jgi:dihydroorotate dehydrogenase (fumarate)
MRFSSNEHRVWLASSFSKGREVMASRTACEYLGLSLNSPIVVGSCPLVMEPEKLRQLIACGAGAVVLPSIFQEQLTAQGQLPIDPVAATDLATQDFRQQIYNGGPDQYASAIQEIKRLSTVPVIASLNGYSDGAWLDFAKQVEASGADALELNVQPVIADPQQPAEEIEIEIGKIVQRVCQSVAIPVAVKTTRHFTNVAHMMQRLRSAGAAGVVLFAHEVHWDVAIDRLQWTTHWELTPADTVGATVAGIVQARLGAADLSLAASGGVRTADDALKVMIAGADVVMVTSEIYRAGPCAISRIVQGVERYLDTHGFGSIHEFRQARPSPKTRTQHLLRLDYLDPLTSSKNYRDPSHVVDQHTGDRHGHRD